MSQITFTNDVNEKLHALLGGHPCVYVLTDYNTRHRVLPLLTSLASARVIVINAGEGSKTLDSAGLVWDAFIRNSATRQAVLVNVGGGMVTDLGGFAASTYMRGIPFVNVPTTLLAAVDAAVGGKTGVNYGGLKNRVGVFAEADHVIVSSCFFATLPHEQLMSGYAEVIKHALLDGRDTLNAALAQNPKHLTPDEMLDCIRTSLAVKQNIVDSDPRESGPRKALNLGHTVGHAIEEQMIATWRHTDNRRPVPHGIAVAWGLVTALVLSKMLLGFPGDTLHSVATYVRAYYPTLPITCDDYDALLELVRLDKKSRRGELNFTLLHDVGLPAIDRAVTPDDLRTALDITRDLLGV